MTHVQTKKGIKIIFIALIAVIALGIICSFINEIIFRSAMGDRSIEDFYKTLETMETVSDVFYVFGLLAMVVVLFGAYNIYTDSSSFSETHNKKTKISCVFLCISVFLSIFYFFRENVDLFIITSSMSNIAYGIGIYLLVMEIAPKFDKHMILIAMISLIAAGVFQLSGSYWYVGSGASLTLGRIGTVLVIVAYIETYIFFTGKDAGLVEGSTEKPIEKKEELTEDIGEEEGPAEDIADKEGPTDDIEEKEEPAEDIADEEGPTEDIEEKEGPAEVVKDEGEEKEEISTSMERIMEDRTREEVINDYAEKFNISLPHAEVLFTSGYYKIEDLRSSSIEELLIIDEINPTIARKVVNYFKD